MKKFKDLKVGDEVFFLNKKGKHVWLKDHVGYVSRTGNFVKIIFEINGNFTVIPDENELTFGDIHIVLDKKYCDNSDAVVSFDRVIDNMKNIHDAKNNDYGNSFSKLFEEFGITSSLIRLSDKLKRLKTLANGKKQEVKDESIEDTLLDLANYAVMTIVELKNNKKKD